jgi:Na+/citrate or Na+/malate symporter
MVSKNEMKQIWFYWILATSAGVAIPVFTISVVPDSSPVFVFIIAGILGGYLMGVVVGAIIGFSLVKLLQPVSTVTYKGGS